MSGKNNKQSSISFSIYFSLVSHLLVMLLVKHPSVFVHLGLQFILQDIELSLVIPPQLYVHLQLISHLVVPPVVLLVLPGDQVLGTDGRKSVVFLARLLHLRKANAALSVYLLTFNVPCYLYFYHCFFFYPRIGNTLIFSVRDRQTAFAYALL